MALRNAFPVFDKVAYLNAGTDGPIAAAAVELAQKELQAQLTEGRLWPHFERRRELTDRLRAQYATVMHCEPGEVAVTSGTSSGLGLVLAGMDLGPHDEIVTSDS